MDKPVILSPFCMQFSGRLRRSLYAIQCIIKK
jgi:hypothetical protein